MYHASPFKFGKKNKCNQGILVPSWVLILSNSNRNYDVRSHNQWSARNWPIAEWMHWDELLLTTTCQSSSTGRPIFLSQLQWQTVTGQSKAKYKLHNKSLECLECRNSKSNRLKLHNCEIWLTIGLEGFYNSVLAFTTFLNKTFLFFLLDWWGCVWIPCFCCYCTNNNTVDEYYDNQLVYETINISYSDWLSIQPIPDHFRKLFSQLELH